MCCTAVRPTSLISGLLHQEGSGDGDLELARQVIELRIGGEHLRNLKSEGRGVNQLIGGYSGQRAAGYVAHHVAAGSSGRKSNSVKRVHHLGSDSMVSQ